MCPRCEGTGKVNDIDLTELFDDTKSIAEGAITIPGYKVDSWWTVGIYTASGFLDPNKPIRDYTEQERHDFLYREPTKVKVNGVNLTYEGLIPKIQKSMLSKDIDSLQPHIRAFVERAATFAAVSRVRRHAAERACPVVSDRRDQHRRCLCHADQRSGRMGARTRRAVRRTTAGGVATDPRLVRRDRTRIPQPGSALGHAVGRRVAARQDDPAPRVVAHRRHLRLRRADHRAAPARHPADERAAAAAAGQGQHRAGRGAQAGDDRDRRPRGRPRARRRHRRRRRWCSRGPSRDCGPAAP